MEALNREDIQEIHNSPLKIKEKILIKLLSLVRNGGRIDNLDPDLIQFRNGRIYEVVIIKSEQGRYVLRFSKNGYHHLAYRETKKLKYFKEKGITVIPRIYHDGILGHDQIYCLQEYKDGEEIGESPSGKVNLELGNLLSELAELHSVRSAGSIWGEPQAENYEYGEYDNFRDFIYTHYISKIDGCDFLPDQSKELLKRGIKKLLSSLEKKPRKAFLVHGDCHPGNIIINAGNAYLIDFGGIHYSLPENDFSRMMHYSSMDRYISDLISKYQKQTGTMLEQNLLDLFFLCRGIKLNIKDKTKTEQFWGKVNAVLDS